MYRFQDDKIDCVNDKKFHISTSFLDFIDLQPENENRCNQCETLRKDVDSIV